jgi:hypothetical protein
MATAKPTGKQKLMGYGLLGLICLFALFIAFVVGPAISESTGVADEYVSFALAAAFFVIAIVCTLLAKSLNKKKAAEGK